MSGSGGRAEAIAASFARKAAFLAAHPDVVILTPPRPLDRWRAVLPGGMIGEAADGATLGAPDLEQLMDMLEEACREQGAPAGDQGTAGAPRG